MKTIRTYIIAAIAVPLLSATVHAQQSNCIGFVAGDSPAQSEVDSKTQAMLHRKVEQILARNNAATVRLYNKFSVYPELTIISEDRVEDGMQKLTYFTGELTLSAINTVDKSSYGTSVVTLTGTGKTKTEAMTQMVQNIKITDPVYTKFIKNAIQKIVDYYTNNMGVVLKKTETLIAQEKYDDAVDFLASIPECVPSYEQSADAIQALIEISASKTCRAAVMQAERYLALGQVEKAAEILLKVKPGTECDTTVQRLAKEVGAAMPVPVQPVVAEQPAPAQPTPAQPVAVQPAATPAKPAVPTVAISNNLSDIDITFLSCTGNKSSQSVTIRLSMHHNKINQNVNFYRSLAFDAQGEEYSTNDTGGRYGVYTVPTDVNVNATITFKGVLPSVDSFSMVQISGTMYDVKTNNNLNIELRNIPIKWE